ncbi:sensor histidine kinase [Flavobacterium sp.]|uniref:sensor histidine kinase n=1 Tax=Flavobacterium sp. TaxID=239 RepID=UPI003D6BCE34
MNSIAFGIIIGFLFISLLVLFCILIVKLYMNKVKNYTQQLFQKDIDFQKAINTAMVETQEQVLNNISQDLHDDAGQQLTYINFQLENLKLDYPNLNDVLWPLSQSVGHLSQSIRSISHSLNNQLLLQQDIVKAIATEVERLQKNPKKKLKLSISQSARKELSANEKIVIYRIFQEIINNCFKHAKATRIDIQIKTYPAFVLSVSDNGKGFDYPVVTDGKRTLGLQNMEHRARIIHYDLVIVSKVNEGTTITLSEKL